MPIDVLIIPRADEKTVADAWRSVDSEFARQEVEGASEQSRLLGTVARHVYRNVYRTSSVGGVPQSLTELMTRSTGVRYPSIHELPTLGGLYLTSFLRRRGFRTAMVRNFYTEKAEIEAILREEKPGLVAVSSTFIATNRSVLKEIATFCRAHHPGAKLLYGGAALHSIKYTLEPPDYLGVFLRSLRGLFDYFILSENGELRLAEVLTLLRCGREPTRLPNVAYFDERGDLVRNAPEPEAIDIDEEIVDWHLIDDEHLHPVGISWTSRGCPFRCKFCTFFKIHEQTGFRSPESIRRELRTLVERVPDVEHVIFTDDNFGIGARRITELTRMLVEEGFPFRWSAFSRPDSITDRTLPLLEASGCEMLCFGVETADEAILESVLKRSTPAKYRRAIRALTDAGMFPLGTFILGLPGETHETILKLVDFVNESGLKFFAPFVYHHLPSNDLYRDAAEHGISGSGPMWQHATMSSTQAAEHFVGVFLALKDAATDLPDVWGTFLALRGEGFDARAIHELVRLKNDLTRDEILAEREALRRQEARLEELDRLLAARVGSAA